jgi:SAM-dependent methyltransferase
MKNLKPPLPPADEAAVVSHFDGMAASGAWSRRYTTLDGRNYQFRVRRTRVFELLPSRLGCVADVGCGSGAMASGVRERGGTFEGVDLSPKMIREARVTYGACEGVSFEQGNVEELRLPSDAYDQVLCIGVIQYLRTPDRALAEIARILRPGGMAIVAAPRRWHVDCLTMGLMAPLRTIAPMLGAANPDERAPRRFQPDQLDSAAKRAGLVPDGGAHYHYTPVPYPLRQIAPGLCMRLNMPFERWHASRAALPSFFAHGYIGRYVKPGPQERDSLTQEREPAPGAPR